MRQLLHEIKGIDLDRCERCQRHISLVPKQVLHIHHKDRNVHNNHSNNLILVCTSCHGKYHTNNRPEKTMVACIWCNKPFKGYAGCFCSKKCAKTHLVKKLDESVEKIEILKNFDRENDAGIMEKNSRCVFCNGTIYPNHSHFCYLKKKNHEDLGSGKPATESKLSPIVQDNEPNPQERECSFCRKAYLGKGIVCSDECGRKLLLEKMKINDHFFLKNEYQLIVKGF